MMAHTFCKEGRTAVGKGEPDGAQPRPVASRIPQLTTYYLLLTTYYSLLTTYYLLLTTYYST